MTAGVVQLAAKLVQFGADQGAPVFGHGAAVNPLLAHFTQFRLMKLAREDQEVVMVKPALSEAGVKLRTDPRFVIGKSRIDADGVDTIMSMRVIAPIGPLKARLTIAAAVIRVFLILKCLRQRKRRQKDRRHADGKRDGGS